MSTPDAVIASTHWQACESCKHADDLDGCELKNGNYSYDMILDGFVCNDYKEKE